MSLKELQAKLRQRKIDLNECQHDPLFQALYPEDYKKDVQAIEADIERIKLEIHELRNANGSDNN